MLQDWIWLTTRKALGPRGVLRVLEYFGTPERAFYADSEQYDQIPELPAAARASLREKRMDEAYRILGECDRLGLRVMTLQDGDYPGRLREIAAPPAVGDAFAAFFRRTSYVPFLQGRALQTIFFADKMRLKMLQNNSASHVKTSAYGEHDGKTAFSFNFL